jgi:hypothetical protein
MTLLLRVLRAVCGVVAVTQALYVLQALAMLPEVAPGSVGKVLALVVIKAGVLAVAGWLFHILRGVINRRHVAQGGTAPKLASFWAL